MCHGCHMHAPTIGMTLAKLVEPNECWEIRTNDYHTTIINKDKTKVFDLLFWCLDGRIETYLFDDPIGVVDETMGGKKAFEM